MTTTEKAPPPVKPAEPANLARWDPFRRVADLQEEMARLWDEEWPFPRPRALRPNGGHGPWLPHLDAFEKDGALIVQAELPGIKKEDVTVTVEDSALVIHGESRSESETKQEDYYRLERSSGTFHRRLPLPFEPTVEDVTATFKDGVLEVRLPRPPAAEQAPRTVAIQ